MYMNKSQEADPFRDDIDKTTGLLLLEFGASWCPNCKAIAPLVAALLDEHPDVRHITIEDGPGKPLGRSFGVKIWPTLCFLRDGQVIEILVRPTRNAIEEGFQSFTRQA